MTHPLLCGPSMDLLKQNGVSRLEHCAFCEIYPVILFQHMSCGDDVGVSCHKPQRNWMCWENNPVYKVCMDQRAPTRTTEEGLCGRRQAGFGEWHFFFWRQYARATGRLCQTFLLSPKLFSSPFQRVWDPLRRPDDDDVPTSISFLSPFCVILSFG